MLDWPGARLPTRVPSSSTMSCVTKSLLVHTSRLPIAACSGFGANAPLPNVPMTLIVSCTGAGGAPSTGGRLGSGESGGGISGSGSPSSYPSPLSSARRGANGVAARRALSDAGDDSNDGESGEAECCSLQADSTPVSAAIRSNPPDAGFLILPLQWQSRYHATSTETCGNL